MPVDNGLLNSMVAVPPEHVTLTVDRESSLNVRISSDVRMLSGKSRTTRLALTVGTASLRSTTPSASGLSGVWSVRGATVGVNSRKAVHTRPNAGLIPGKM